MITEQRRKFNHRFTEGAYGGLLDALDRQSGTHVSFRVAETPCFLQHDLVNELARTGAELTAQLLGNADYLQSSLDAIPASFRMEANTPHPHFMTADFGFVREADGRLAPKLVEMQAFPSVYAFQVLLGDMYRESYRLDPQLTYFLNGYTRETFWELFRDVVVHGHDPDEVVLAELHPEQQKTLPDFLLTSRALGIPVVDVTQIEVSRENGRTRLFYRSADGRLRQIRRIYNRVIADELIQKNVTLPYDYREALDVEWAGHPNWYFRISKYSIPYLKHPSVPEAVFLDDWLAGKGSGRLHGGRSAILLKPLFSYAGSGILFDPTDQDLAAIPVSRQREYLIQERVNFAPTIETPFGPTQAEIRVLYLWPDGDPSTALTEMRPVLSLARLGRGKMMGVDHNRGQQWVGASTVFVSK